jgi:hypothetical protein
MRQPDTDNVQNEGKSALYEQFARTILAYLCQQVSNRQDIVPAGTKPHLLTMQSITCGSYGGSYGLWATLSTNVLHEPKSFVQSR